MNSLPKISVVMPSLNQGKYIGEAIRSVLLQEYPNRELIVIDGGSSDRTLDIIKKYAAEITYWTTEPDNGQAEAINKGFSIATGDVVTWLNSDDQYEPGTFKRVASHFTQFPGTSILHGRAFVFGNGRRGQVKGDTGDLPNHLHLAYMRFPQPASFLSRTAIDLAGKLDESLHYAMDFDLVAKIVLNGGVINAVPDIFARYRMHEASKSNEEEKFAEEWKNVLLNILDSMPVGKKASGLLVSALGDSRQKTTNYVHRVVFSEKDLLETATDHLHLQFHTAYRHGQSEKCKRILNVLDEHLEGFTEKRGYRRYLLRLQIVPRIFFNIYRRLTK